MQIPQVNALNVIRPQIIWSERDGPIDLTQYVWFVIGVALSPSVKPVTEIGISVVGQRIGVIRVDLKRLLGLVSRGNVAFLRRCG